MGNARTGIMLEHWIPAAQEVFAKLISTRAVVSISLPRPLDHRGELFRIVLLVVAINSALYDELKSSRQENI
jgi:hypothetical protein